MHKTLLAALATLVLSLTATGASATPGGPSARAVADGFFQTVFGLEHGHHPDAQKVKRYTGVVRFHVSDRSGRNRLPAARQFLTSLPKRIRHFKGVEVQRARDANFRILLVRGADFVTTVRRELRTDATAMGARCIVGVTTHNGHIGGSVAIIVADDDYLFARCLVEEVLQGLGPMNDSNELAGSVFNDSSHHTVFTEFDAGILNVLYHPAIRPGMSGRDVHRALPIALRDLGYR
ncbi:MAG: DUF2927 domain-containing protein [Pseudomonadota bacterium]